jgi:cytidylate kinase
METKKKLTIAIDGYSSCGKSTLAKDLAVKLNYSYIDTGAMYRAVALYCLQNNLMLEDGFDIDNLQNEIDNIQIDFIYSDEHKKSMTYLNGTNVETEIRKNEISKYASDVSAIGFVRKRLVALQQEMRKEKGIVMDGRDIGTVVFPDADLKIFMTADPDIRAKRRFDELAAKGDDISFEKVKADMASRDYNDENRKESPLRKAEDAIVLDNSNLTKEDQLNWIIDEVNKISC